MGLTPQVMTFTSIIFRRRGGPREESMFPGLEISLKRRGKGGSALPDQSCYVFFYVTPVRDGMKENPRHKLFNCSVRNYPLSRCGLPSLDVGLLMKTNVACEGRDYTLAPASIRRSICSSFSLSLSVCLYFHRRRTLATLSTYPTNIKTTE